MTTVRIIGPGRAGLSFAHALEVSAVRVNGVLGRGDDLYPAADGVDLLLLAVPDREIASVAARVRPHVATVVAHCSGALGLEVLAGHDRRACIHPLVTLPDPSIGSDRLRSGAHFALAGDTMVADIVRALGGQPLLLPPEARATYHAAACIASNHLVALLGQVERVASSIGLPLGVFLPLAKGALDDVAFLGPMAALTGPASRDDTATIEQHRRALEPEELEGYDAGVALARRLVFEAARSDGLVGATTPWS